MTNKELLACIRSHANSTLHNADKLYLEPDMPSHLREPASLVFDGVRIIADLLESLNARIDD